MPCSAFLRRSFHLRSRLAMSLSPAAPIPARKALVCTPTNPVLGSRSRSVFSSFGMKEPVIRSRLEPLSHARRGSAPVRSVDLDWRDARGGASQFFQQPGMSYGRIAYDDYSEDESEREMETPSKSSSTLDNVEWKWKLTMLLRSKDEQEIVSREKKDRRDYEQISALAFWMGLRSRQYVKLVVFSTQLQI